MGVGGSVSSGTNVYFEEKMSPFVGKCFNMEIVIAVLWLSQMFHPEPIKQLSVGKISENILRSVSCPCSRLWLIWARGGGRSGD